jgi:imidazolonepropionase-like amidohydrolase
MTTEELLITADAAFDPVMGLLSDGVELVVRDGVIESLGPTSERARTEHGRVVELPGTTLLPGLIDAHMHFFGIASDRLGMLPFDDLADRALRAAGEAARVLRRGITSVRCLGSAVGIALGRAIDEGYVLGPRIIAAGEFVCATGGTWDHLALPVETMRSMDMLADGEDELRAIVRRRSRAGARVLKIGVSKGMPGDSHHAWGADPAFQRPTYSAAELSVVVATAHDEGLQVAAHAIGDDAVQRALIAGVDTIEHGFGISEATRAQLAETQRTVVTTFSLMRFLAREESDPRRREDMERHIAAQRSDFELGLKAGVKYALGSDLGGPPATPQDEAWQEVETAVRWGMTPEQALASATAVSADAIGMGGVVGRLAPGFSSDVIAVRGNPVTHIRSLGDVALVMKGGQVIHEAVA